MKIPLDESILSIKELDTVASLVLQNDFEERIVEIECLRAVERIDLAFIGGLLLLYEHHDRFKKKTLSFVLKGAWGSGDGYWKDVFASVTDQHELVQCIRQISVLYRTKSDWISIYGLGDLVSKPVKVSGFFSPVLFVHRATMKWMFEKDATDYGGYRSEYINRIKNRSGANTNEIEYFNQSKSVIDKLGNNPVIYTFVFSILFFSSIPFVNNSGENAIKEVESIWNFTLQFVSGLKELAKNIVSHSEFQMGIITMRAYWDEERKMRKLETHVFDYGRVGIIPTMNKELENQTVTSKEDEDDLAVISSGEYQLKDLMTRSDKLLFRQIHREMAHLGLIHFVSLINSHKGWYSVATQRLDGGREELGDSVGERNLSMGTSFHFTLPLNIDYSVPQTSGSSSDQGLSQEQIKALLDFLQKKDAIQIVRLWAMNISTRRKEQALIQKLPSPEENKQYYAIDFSKVIISSTSLLRVLAKISLLLEKSLIVYNVNVETLSEMLGDNQEYFSRMADFQNVCYWLKGKSILIYSQSIEGDERFYFADILFGQSQNDFLGLNLIINQTFPNYVSVSSIIDNPIPFTFRKEEMQPILPFFSGMVLLPFDIALMSYNPSKRYRGSLFNHNLNYLLNKEIDGTV